jgi:Cu-processing system ATP-binding protein
MIEIQDVSKTYSGLKALSHVSATFAAERVTGVVGPNSCGKTTLMKSVLGLVLPEHGEIRVNGKSIQATPSYRAEIGYMAQATMFPENLKVHEIFRLLEELRRAKAVRKTELSDYFQLEKILETPFGVLSGGAKQRVGAVVAMMFDAPILILDEPTASLDPVAAMRMREMIAAEQKRGKTIVLISHSIREIEDLATRALMLIEGRAVFEGEIRDFREKYECNTLEQAIVEHFGRYRKEIA